MHLGYKGQLNATVWSCTSLACSVTHLHGHLSHYVVRRENRLQVQPGGLHLQPVVHDILQRRHHAADTVGLSTVPLKLEDSDHTSPRTKLLRTYLSASFTAIIFLTPAIKHFVVPQTIEARQHELEPYGRELVRSS